MNDPHLKEEGQKLYLYLGSVADALVANNLFQAHENLAALKKLLKGQSSAAAEEVQKRFFDIAKVVKQHRKELALQQIRDVMRKLEPLLPS